MQPRKSNMELLRIFSIFMIIIFHCAYKSGFNFSPGFSANQFLIKSFWMLGELGVNLFMLISGYFMACGQFKWKKLIRLLIEVMFYTQITLWFGNKLGIYALSGWKERFLSFFPVLLNRYWFITAYLVVYILSPFLNLLAQAMNRRTYRKFLSTVLVLYCVIPTCMGIFYNTSETMLYYNRLIWLIIIYFIGEYLSIYNQYDKYIESIVRKRITKTIGITASIMLISIVFIDRFHDFFEILGTTEAAYFWHPNTIPMVLLSIAIFLWFQNCRLSYHPVINTAASTTLGIYLLHDGILSSWLWKTVFRCADYQNSPFLCIRILMAALIIFFAGAGIDLLRQFLEKHTLVRLLDSKSFNQIFKGGNMLKECKNFISHNRRLLLFFTVFLFYVFGGLCISYQVAFSKNIFFGADNARAFRDLTDIGYSHYRTKVHPLFPLLTETITLLVDGIVNYPAMSVILVESFCGALSVCLFDAIMEQRNVGKSLRNLFTGIYAFSFSTIIFSTVPETFIFAATGLLGFWYFISVSARQKGVFTRQENVLLVFFGVLCCGITLTNYVFYLFGIIYLLSCRYPFKEAVKSFFKIQLLNIGVLILACLFQKFVWNQCPLFWDSLLEGVINPEAFEETRYMNWDFNILKTKQWLKQTLLCPLISPTVYLHNPGTDDFQILFGSYSGFLKVFLLCFLILQAFCFIAWLINIPKQYNHGRDGYVICLLAAYLGNLILHYIYGFYETFIFSQHYLFYILLATALVLNGMKNQMLKQYVTVGFGVFLLTEGTNNIKRFFQTAEIALSTADTFIKYRHAVEGTILCAALLATGILGWKYISAQYLDSRPVHKGTKAYTWKFCIFAGVYGILIMVTGLFIAFNY